MGKKARISSLPEEISFQLLRVKASTAALMHGFDWKLPARLYTDTLSYLSRLLFLDILILNAEDNASTAKPGQRLIVIALSRHGKCDR
jgi:hypothetical protein